MHVVSHVQGMSYEVRVCGILTLYMSRGIYPVHVIHRTDCNIYM